MSMINIKEAIVWGDSVAKGVIYDEIKNKYSIAKESASNILSETLGIKITNRSKMGMTSEAGLEIVCKDIERGLRADVAIIEFGGNDCDYHWDKIAINPDEVHVPFTPLEVFAKKMTTMIEKVKETGMKPILVSLPPIVSEKYFKFVSRNVENPENILSWLGDVEKITRHHKDYSDMVKKIAIATNCVFIDIRDSFLKLSKEEQSKFMCVDGIHPNIDGQKLIASSILNFLS